MIFKDTKPHERIRAVAGGGLPIGNLTSQLYGNLYLSDFDHYVKKELKIEHYGRYVDDFFIFTNNKPKLKSLLHHLQQHIKNNFGLQIHPKKIYLQHYTKGIAFLGAYIKPYRMYIGNRTKIQFKNKLSKITAYLQQNNVILQKTAHHIVSVINSYLGLLSHYNTYNLRHKLLFYKPPLLVIQNGVL